MKKIIFAFAFVCTSISSFTQILYTNNFSGGSAGWTLDYGGTGTEWVVNNTYGCSTPTPNQGGANYMHIADDLGGDYCAFAGYYGLGSGVTIYATQTADINTMGYATVMINFDWLCIGQTGPILASYGFIDYSTNGGANWINITSPIAQYNGQPNWTSIAINNPAMANHTTVRIRFGFLSQGYGTNPAFAVDNLTITGVASACTNVGGTANASPSTICSGNTSIVTVTGHNGTIQWEQSPDGIGSWANVTGGSGATTATYTTTTLLATTYYRAKLSQVTCADVYSTVTSVTVNPTVVAGINIAANPAGPVCEGTDVLFTATPANGGATPTYQWFINGNPAGTGSTYSNNNLNNNDQVSCTLTSNATCVTGNPASSNTIAMTVNSNPVATITPPGPLTYCSDTTIVLYCGPVGTYIWSDATTGNSTTPVTSGNYCVTVVDANGCSDTTCVLVTIHPAPNVSINGNDSICEGDLVTLTASGADTYLWSTTQIINPITVSPTGNTTYTVTGTESIHSCTSTSTISIVATPNTIDASTSSLSPVTVHANANASTYQWIDCTNGNIPLSGETGQNFTATVNGSYAVIVAQGGCSDTSTCIAITPVGIEENNSSEISIYPNPSNGIFTVQSTLEGNCTLINELGQTVRLIQLNAANNYTVYIEGIRNGIYFMVGKNEQGTIRQKIMVAN